MTNGARPEDGPQVGSSASHDLREPTARSRRDDLSLARACVAGDDRAWHELAARHFDFMRGFARRFLPPAAARELADEVIANLWTRGKLRQYEGRSSLRTWLGAVVAHAALNSRQALNRVASLEARTTPTSTRNADPEEAEASRLLRDMLDRAIRALAPEDRLLLQLYYEQGLTLDQIGAVLGGSSTTHSRRLKHVREELRAAVDALSRSEAGESAEALRAGVDLDRVEIDLGKLLVDEMSKPQRPAGGG